MIPSFPGDGNNGSPPPSGPGAPAALAWPEHAEPLAAWADEKLVNRRDCWGAYTPSSPTTRPAKCLRGKVVLSREHLVRHFVGRCREDVVGLHSTSPMNTSKWGALDIDAHGEMLTAGAVNFRAALAWYGELVRRGFHPLLTDSNGKGGFHLMVLLSEPVPTPRVHAFLKQLLADHGRHGMAVPPECFPKQPAVAPPGQPGQYGNWLRLPGRHHTRDHWSRFWNGTRWLAGAEAVEYLLAQTGDPVALVPELPPPEPSRPARLRTAHYHGSGGRLGRRIAAYVAKLPTGLGEGMGRDDVAFGLAAFLARDLALSDEIALAWLERWDQHNAVRKGAAALAEILQNATRYGRNSVGSGLRPEIRRGHVLLTATTGGRR
jgi:hypothetical protein